MTTRIRVAIASAAHFEPRRRPGLERLRAALSIERLRAQRSGHILSDVVFLSEEREPAILYSRRRLEWAASPFFVRDDVLCLDDDVTLSPLFFEALSSALEIVPSRCILGLHVTSPWARALADSGHRFARTDHVTGPAYVLRGGIAKEALDFLDSSVAKVLTDHEKSGDDTLMMRCAAVLQIPVFMTLPALACHDVSIPSTYGPGYDAHPERVPSVPWTLPRYEGAPLLDWRTKADVGPEGDFAPPFVPCSWWKP